MTTIICFWCREVACEEELPPKGDVTAPERAIVDYEPCAACRKKFSDGIVFAEVEMEPQSPGQFPVNGAEVQHNPNTLLYPTGRYIVVTEDVIPTIMRGDAAKECLATRRALITREVFELFAPEDSHGQTIN